MKVIVVRNPNFTLAERIPFHDQVLRAFEGGEREIAVEMGDVEFLGAAGIGTLVIARNLLASGGGGLTIRGLRPDMKALFTLTKTEDLFEWEEAGGRRSGRDTDRVRTGESKSNG